MFPESLESRLSTFDDFIIRHVQMLLSTVTIVMAKMISGMYVTISNEHTSK